MTSCNLDLFYLYQKDHLAIAFFMKFTLSSEFDFDTIGLTFKLEQNGITGNLLNLLCDFQKTRVLLNEQFPD